MKNIIFKFLLFIIIIGLIISVFFNKIFLNEYVPFRDTMSHLNKVNKDSIDILFFGSSHAFSTFNPEIIDNALGTFTFNLGSADQRLNVTNYLLKEVLKETKPKLVILEVFFGAIKLSDSDESKGFQLNVIDNTPLSLRKLKLVNEIYNFKELPSVLSPTIRNHSKWFKVFDSDNEKQIEERRRNEKNIRGFVGSIGKIKEDVKANYSDFYQKDYELLDEENINSEIDKKQKKRILDFIELTDSHNVKILLVTSPFISALYSKKILDFESSISKLADSLNIDYINYNTKFRNLDLRFSDFRDPGHTNIKGSIKISSMLADYLVKHKFFDLKNENYLNSYLNEIKERSVFNDEEMSNLEEKELIEDIFKKGKSLEIIHDFSQGLRATNISFYSDQSKRYIAIEYNDPLPDNFIDNISFGVQGNAYKEDLHLLPSWVRERNLNRVTWITNPEIYKTNNKTFVLLTLKKNCEIENWEEFRLYYVDSKSEVIGNRLDLKNIYFSEVLAESKMQELYFNIFSKGKSLEIIHDFSQGLKATNVSFYSDESKRYIAIEYNEPLSNDFTDNISFGVQGNAYKEDLHLLPTWVRERNLNRVTWITKVEMSRVNDRTFVLLTLKKNCEIENWEEFRLYYVNDKKEITGNRLNLKHISFKE